MTDDRRVEAVLGAMALAGTILALIGIAEEIGHFSLASLSGGVARFDVTFGYQRVSGPFPAPEPYALALLTTLAATLCWLRIRPPRVRVLAVLVVVLQVAAIALTYFRASWLSEIVVVVGMLALIPAGRARRITYLALATAVIYVGFLQVQQDPAINSRINNQENVSGRLATYKVALNIWRVSPLTGVGVNQFEAVQPTVPGATVAGISAVNDPHSSFFSVLAELGALGFAALLALFVTAFQLIRALSRRARRPLDRVLATTAAVAGLAYLIMSLTLTMISYGPSNDLFAILLGCVAARVDVLGAEARRTWRRPPPDRSALPAG